MTVKLNPVVITSDSWRTLVERVNEVIDVLDTKVMSANSANTIGNATLTGSFTANAIFVGSQAVVTVARGVGTGAGLTGGGALSANLTIALNANTIASLAKADTALQANAFTGKLGLKEKIAVPGDIQASGTANSLTVLAGDGSWRVVSAIGDMARVVYDPTNVNADVFARSNHVGTQSSNTIVGLDTALANLNANVNARMVRTIYDPNLVAGDVYARENHSGTQPANTITGLANVATQGTYASLTERTAIEYGAPQPLLTGAQRGQARANIDAGIVSGFRNKVINGEFWISQRDPNLPSNTGNRFGTDRWISYATTKPCLVERKLLNLTEPGVNSALEITPYYLRTTVGAGTATNSRASLNQRLENVRTLAGRRATLSFYARADAAKDIAIEFYQRFDNSSTAAPFVPVSIPAGRVSLTTVWKRFDVVVDIPSIIGKELGIGSWLEMAFWFSAGSSFSESTGGLGEQTGVFEITRISLVEGDATAEDDPFEPRHIQQELALCQRYYETGRAAFGGYVHTASFNYYTSQNFKVTKRTTPSVTVLAELSLNASEQSATNTTAEMFSYLYKAAAQGDIYVAATWIADAEL